MATIGWTNWFDDFAQNTVWQSEKSFFLSTFFTIENMNNDGMHERYLIHYFCGKNDGKVDFVESASYMHFASKLR